jgi:hypothetical protein
MIIIHFIRKRDKNEKEKFSLRSVKIFFVFSIYKFLHPDFDFIMVYFVCFRNSFGEEK